MNRLLLCGAIVWILVAAAAPSAQPPSHPARDRRGVPLFVTSDNCVACHNGLTTSEGEDVSIGTMWRSTMMGNAARDPYFQAGVRREVIDHPSLSADIQDECAACHMPMLQRAAHEAGRTADIFAQLPIATSVKADNHPFAADGVSCTVCHQVSADQLGSRDTFNGRFVLQPTPPDGVRKMFGPYDADPGRTRIMRSVTGFAQAKATHLQRSELCATCHTLYTEAHGSKGEVVGQLPEQMNFQEWQHSAFYGEQRSCQSCHMPRVDGTSRIASVLGDVRDGLSRHLFVGGNFLLLRIFKQHRAELGVLAEPSELDATANATVRQLQTETATVAVEHVTRGPDALTLDAVVTNLAGHKMPTGYPSRRAWIHLTVRDAQARVVFESGAVREDGSIVGNDNDADGGKVEPHYDEISGPDQVQIYESIMAGLDGAVTTGLLQATRYLKDNRLLPRGFDKATAHPDVAVHGGATADVNFTGGSDKVHYVIPVGASGPLAVELELRYQPIAYRWAQNLTSYDAPEPRRFTGYFSSVARDSSVVVAHATARAE